MANLVRIQTSNVSRFSNKVQLPDVGEVLVSESGIVEVPEEVADILVNKGKGWSFAEPQGAEEESDDETHEDDVENDEDERSDDESEEATGEFDIVAQDHEELVNFFNQEFSVKELRKLMTDQEYEPLDNKLNKEQIIEIVIESLKDFNDDGKAKLSKLMQIWKQNA